MLTSQNREVKLPPNTLDDWIPLFEYIGISKELLTDTAAKLEKVQFAKLFDACKRYNKHFGVITFQLEQWQLLLLSQDPKAIADVIADPNVAQSDQNGLKPIHYILLSGNVDKAKTMLEASPELLIANTTLGGNTFISAILSGDSAVITAVLDMSLQLLDVKDFLGRNALHFATLSGEPAAINIILAKKPDLLETVTERGENALHFAALSGEPAAINTILAKIPKLLETTDSSGKNLLHFAARSNNPAAIEAILAKKPELLETTDESGNNALHFAAAGACVKTIDAIYAKKPELLEKTNCDGQNALLYAANNGAAAINAILAKKPELLTSIDSKQNNIFHTLIYFEDSSLIENIIRRFPHESAKLWAKNINGVTPDAMAIGDGLKITPTSALRAVLKTALSALLNHDKESLQSSIKLINAYNEKLVEFIIQGGMATDAELSQLIVDDAFTQAMGMAAIKKLKPALALRQKRTALVNQSLTMKDLEEIITTAEQGLELASNPGLFQRLPTLITDLKMLLAKIKPSDAGELPDDAVTVLVVMINDYQRRGMNQTTRGIENAAIAAIEASKTLQLLKPQAKKAEGLDISPANFTKHLAACRQTFGKLTGISEDTRRITNIVLDGIEHILNNREKIIEHVRTKYGVLYYVDAAEKLPLHTDHVDISKPNEYYKTLGRLVQSFFGAFYIAEEAGQLKTFCDKVSSGYCFEGKVRDPFEWVIALSEIQSFDKLMGQYIKEYLTYAKVMHDKNEDAVSFLQPATDFICERHEEFFCKPDDKFAPGGVVTRQGVSDYLEQIMSYENENVRSEQSKP